MKARYLIIVGIGLAVAWGVYQMMKHAQEQGAATYDLVTGGGAAMAGMTEAETAPALIPGTAEVIVAGGPVCNVTRYAGDFWKLPAPPSCVRSCPEGWVATEIKSMTGDRPLACAGLECLEPICHNQSGDTQSGREPLWVSPGAVSKSNCDRFEYYEQQHGCLFPRPDISKRTVGGTVWLQGYL